jgi:hypothetical protein
VRRNLVVVWLSLAGALRPVALPAESVAVRQAEGAVHAFLALRTLEGQSLAEGDLVQFARGDRVTSRVTFQFKDGSVHDETAVFSQHRHFKLVTDHLVQKGPSFPQPMEVSVDRASNRVTVRYRDKDGKEKVADERLDLPADVANGLMFTLVKNLAPEVQQTTVSMVAATPKPRLVKLLISPAGEERFSIGDSRRKAVRFVVKVEIGGVAGVLAPLMGKQPPDTSIWILPGEVPAFVKSEGQLYFGGPVWRIEPTNPIWSQPKAATPQR